ncbi:MAG: LytR C-terminal domain-containing protein [Candidatus Levyibacteriota bacterium]
MNETSSFQQQPAYVQKTSNKKRLLIIFFIILLLLIIGLVGFYMLGGKTKQQATPTKPVPTAEPSPTVVATPIASNSAAVTATPSADTKLDRTTLQVSVQNGSGTVGVAQKIADTLKKAGYTKITTGNADAYTYEGITIHVKKKDTDYLPDLQKDLTTAYPKANIKATIDDTISTDAEVIVGHY